MNWTDVKHVFVVVLVLVVALVLIAGAFLPGGSTIDPWDFIAAIGVRPPEEPPVESPTLKLFNEGVNALLTEDLPYDMASSGLTVTVPRGFVSDFASIPVAFRSMLSPIGKHGRAAIIHDYLYWQQECTREQADRIMLLAMTESGVSFIDRRAIYWTLRRFGLNAWVDNNEERKQGLPRRVPDPYMALPRLAEWPPYRRELFQRGIRPDPRATIPPEYCAAAMTIDIGQ